jgi:hypothetical protein
MSYVASMMGILPSRLMMSNLELKEAVVSVLASRLPCQIAIGLHIMAIIDAPAASAIESGPQCGWPG